MTLRWIALPLLTGCMGVIEAGYVNRAPLDAGGLSVQARGAMQDPRDDGIPLGVDAVASLDATVHGSRLSLGAGLSVAPWSGWDQDFTPYARAALAGAVARSGKLADGGAALPSLELGVLFYPERTTHSRAVYTLGARAALPGGQSKNLEWGVFAGYGGSYSFYCCP